MLYNKNRLEKIGCPEEEKQGFRNLHSVFFFVVVVAVLYFVFVFFSWNSLSYPLHTWRHGLREVGLEIEKPLESPMSEARFRVVYDLFI